MWDWALWEPTFWTEVPELALGTAGVLPAHGWGVEVPALFSRSGVGDMTKRKRTQKRSGRLVTKHPQKSPTCEATRSITWQSRPTTLLAPGPPAPQSTSLQRSHVSPPGHTRCSCLGGFLTALSFGFQVFSSLKELGDVSLLLLCAQGLPAFFFFFFL